MKLRRACGAEFFQIQEFKVESIPKPTGVIVRQPSPALRAQIHAIIVGHMASALIASQADLSNLSACRDAMFATGFGEQSIDHLLTRAIDAARLCLAATQET